jgi:hypothetical protein
MNKGRQPARSRTLIDKQQLPQVLFSRVCLVWAVREDDIRIVAIFTAEFFHLISALCLWIQHVVCPAEWLRVHVLLCDVSSSCQLRRSLRIAIRAANQTRGRGKRSPNCPGAV